MSAEESVREAQRKLERESRVESVQRRIRASSEVAKYHEGVARTERGKIATLVRTWNLCPSCYEPLPDDYESSGDAAAYGGNACALCYVGQ